MRRAVPFIVSLLLGVGVALLAACGGETKGAIPSASASDLKRQLEDIRERVEGGKCKELNGQLRQADERIDSLSDSVDGQLKQALREGVTRLREKAPDDCSKNATPTQTQTVAPVTTTETTAPKTETTPPTTTPPTTTEQTTEEPPTEDLPPPELPEPPPAPEPPPSPPPVDPSGGTPPEIP